MGGCAFVTTALVLSTTLKAIYRQRLHIAVSTVLIVVLVGISAATGAFLALALSVKDVVRQRIARGEQVNLLLRIYFGMGFVSLVAWFPTVLVIGVVAHCQTCWRGR